MSLLTDGVARPPVPRPCRVARPAAAIRAIRAMRAIRGGLRGALAVPAVALLACGGGDSRTPPAASSDSAVTAPASDTASGPPSAEDPGAGDATSPDAGLPAWTTEPVEVEGSGEPGRQVDLRTGRHDDFDRVVLIFSNHVPGYTVRFASDPLRQCGSGKEVRLEADHAVEVELRPARAHNERGRSTLAEREASPHLPELGSARVICDYEGTVTWALGVERRTAYRVFTLEGPARLVIDVRH